MSFVTTKEMLKKAQKERYAVGAFNANNMEIIQAIIETAEEEKAPVILQASQGAIKYAGLDSIVAMVKVMAEKANVPVALHLDHGTDYYQNIKCLRAGFTSLMYDGSKLSFDENVKMTKKVVEMAHACDIPVEAELGQIGKMGDSDEPGVALERVKESMAVPERELTGVPLVLHGASGANDEEIKKGIAAGICKINIDTRIRMQFTEKIREIIKTNPEEIDPRKILGPAKEAAKEIIRDRIRVFGCSGKA
jgi:fructose-bisphosphate aldolase class II